jgi:hypothetical protein
MAKQTFAKDDNFHIEIEEVGDQCHVHCTVVGWRKSVAYRGYLYFVELKAYIKSLGYECFYSITPNPKFCEMYGGQYIGEQDGKEVMIWVT